MNKIKSRHAISIGILFSLGSIVINMGFNNEYLIQSLIISFLVSSIIIYFYQVLLNKYPNKNLFQIINEKQNNILGKILIIFLLIILLINSVQIIYSFIDFISTINQLDFLSKNMIMLLNFILLGYILKNTLINLSRFSQVIFVLTSLMIVLLFIVGIKDMEFINLLPLYSFQKNDIFNNMNILVVQPFLEITLLFNVFSKMENTKIKKNIFIITSGLSLLLLLLISIESITLLGDNYTGFLNFPYYVAISCINMSKLVIRIESLSLVVFYFSSFVKLLFIINSFMLGFNTLTNTKRKYNYPILLLSHVLSLIMFDNLGELKQFMNYYSLSFIIISILIPFFIFIKKDKNIIKQNT